MPTIIDSYAERMRRLVDEAQAGSNNIWFTDGSRLGGPTTPPAIVKIPCLVCKRVCETTKPKIYSLLNSRLVFENSEAKKKLFDDEYKDFAYVGYCNTDCRGAREMNQRGGGRITDPLNFGFNTTDAGLDEERPFDDFLEEGYREDDNDDDNWCDDGEDCANEDCELRHE